MKNQIELLVKLGLSEKQSVDFIKSIALDSYKRETEDYCRSPKSLTAFIKEDLEQFENLLE